MISFFGAPAAAVAVVLAHPVTRVMAATAQRTLVRAVNIFFIRFVVMLLSVVEKRYEFSGVRILDQSPIGRSDSNEIRNRSSDFALLRGEG